MGAEGRKRSSQYSKPKGKCPKVQVRKASLCKRAPSRAKDCGEVEADEAQGRARAQAHRGHR